MKKADLLRQQETLDNALSTRRKPARVADLEPYDEPATPAVPQRGIPSETIPPPTIPADDIPQEGIPEGGIPQRDRGKRKAKSKPTGILAVEFSAARGYYPTFNDLDDIIIPGLKLDTYEQAVLRRMYRLSRGNRSLDCEIGYGGIVDYCNMSRSRAQEAVESLLSRGVIRWIASGGQFGTIYRVLEQFPAIPQKGISQDGIPEGGKGVPQSEDRGIPQDGNNKNNKDGSKNTHTNTGGVGVGSRFSLEECKRYAEHLQLKGEGIKNPGGYATAIYRSGEADALIELFLSPPVEVKRCARCEPTGYVQVVKDGVTYSKRCDHREGN